MAKITTELPVEFDGNNLNQEYTRYKDILEFNIKAPNINYCPLSILKKINSAKHYFDIDHIHSDFSVSSGSGAWATQYQILLPLLDVNRKYTLYYEVKNVTGIIPNESFGIGFAPNSVAGGNIATGSVGVVYQAFNYNNINNIRRTFTFQPKEAKTLLCVWRSANYSASNFKYDLYIYGLYEEMEDYQEDSIYINTNFNSNISSFNEQNFVGEYKISRDVNRHLKQIERKISDLTDRKAFELLWR